MAYLPGNLGLRNEWTFGGELFSKKLLDGEFGASLKVRGISQRTGSETTQICELTCLVPREEAEKFAELHVYDSVVLSGHIETWQKVNNKGVVNYKQMFIVDLLLETTKK